MMTEIPPDIRVQIRDEHWPGSFDGLSLKNSADKALRSLGDDAVLKKVRSDGQDLYITYVFPLKQYLDSMIDFGITIPVALNTIRNLGAPQDVKDLAAKYIKQELYGLEREKRPNLLSIDIMPKSVSIEGYKSRDVVADDPKVGVIHTLHKPVSEYDSWDEVVKEIEAETGAKYQLVFEEDDVAIFMRVDDVQ